MNTEIQGPGPACPPDARLLAERLRLTAWAYRQVATEGIWATITIDRDAVCSDLELAAKLLTR